MNEVVIKLIGNYSYQTTHCLGEGVYGKVFEGMERDTKEKVAIKKVDLSTFTNDKYLENAIFSQIYLLKRFNHPNIVKFKDVLSSKNSLYIITEFCKHGDLKEMIKRKRFKDEEAFEVVRQIACGFCQLIQEKIVHRDLKPANILIHDGTYKIADFGFAKYVDNFGSQMLKSCVGSPIYMAPQVLERTPYTTKCDIWSIGIIFYEMLFGSPPWKARDEAELIKMVKTIPISSILKREPVSLKAAEFLKRALAYNEDERFSWTQIFDMFSVKSLDKAPDDNSTAGSQQSQLRGRYMTSVGVPQRSTTPNKNTKKEPAGKYFGNAHSSSPVIEKRPTAQVQSTNQMGISGAMASTGQSGSTNSYDIFKKARDECLYRYFLCAELLIGLPIFKEANFDSFKFARQLYLVSLAIKIKNQTTVGLVALCSKLGKQFEQLQGRMLKDQQNYDELERDILALAEAEGHSRRLRDELAAQLGSRLESLSQDKIIRLQQLLLDSTYENAGMLLAQLRKKGRACSSQSSQLLEWMSDLITLGASKDKGLQEVSLLTKGDQMDPAEYFQRASSRLQRVLNS